MTCRSELRGLGAVKEAIEAKKGQLLAVSSAPLDDLATMVAEDDLSFHVLSDPGCAAIRGWGLLHEGGAPDGSDIAVPAQFLLRADGSIAWRHVAGRITDRAGPLDTVAAIAEL